MRGTTDPGVLWGRAVLLASVTVFLGVLGHVTADGLLPGPLAIAVLYVVAVVAAAALLARPASAVRLVVLLVGGQTAVHLVLSTAAGHAGDAAPRAVAPPAVGGSLPTVDGRRVGAFQDAFDVGAAHSGGPSLPVGHLLDHLTGHAPMMLAHLLVAAAVGLWLAVGERALFTLLALAVRVVVARLQPLPVVRRPAPRTPAAPRRPASLLLLDSALARRGPPLVAH